MIRVRVVRVFESEAGYAYAFSIRVTLGYIGRGHLLARWRGQGDRDGRAGGDLTVEAGVVGLDRAGRRWHTDAGAAVVHSRHNVRPRGVVRRRGPRRRRRGHAPGRGLAGGLVSWRRRRRREGAHVPHLLAHRGRHRGRRRRGQLVGPRRVPLPVLVHGDGVELTSYEGVSRGRRFGQRMLEGRVGIRRGQQRVIVAQDRCGWAGLWPVVILPRARPGDRDVAASTMYVVGQRRTGMECSERRFSAQGIMMEA